MPLKPPEIIRKLVRLGFVEKGGRGSHRVFVHPDGRLSVVPFHRKELGIGLYKEILKQIGMTEEEFDGV